jgi:hypothetical protein
LESTVGSFADQPSSLLPINRRLFCQSTVGSFADLGCGLQKMCLMTTPPLDGAIRAASLSPSTAAAVSRGTSRCVARRGRGLDLVWRESARSPLQPSGCVQQ